MKLIQKKWLATLAIFGAAALVIQVIPAVRNLDFHVHGWAAWVAVLVVTFVVSIAFSYLKAFCTQLFGVNPRNSFSVVGGHIAVWLGLGFSYFIMAVLFPGEITYNSGLGVLLLALIMGIALGLYDLVDARVDAKTDNQ